MPLGLWTTSGPVQDPGLDKQLQCNESNEAKYTNVYVKQAIHNKKIHNLLNMPI